MAVTGIPVTAQNFQQVILQGSQEKLVIVDFWADWCEPCKQLMPVLEKLANEYQDRVTLVTIDCEAEQQLAAQFGIRSLPTVAFFKDGKPVDGFAGVEPEQSIRQRIEQHVPGPADDALVEAKQALANKDYDQAYTLAKQAHDFDAENLQAKLLLAEAAVHVGRLEQTKSLLATIGLVDQDADYQHVVSLLEMAEQAADSPELRALQEQADANPDDAKLRLELAAKLFEAQRTEEALEQAFSVLRKDMGNADARKQTLDMLNALPKGDPLAAKYRRALYSMLY